MTELSSAESTGTVRGGGGLICIKAEGTESSPQQHPLTGENTPTLSFFSLKGLRSFYSISTMKLATIISFVRPAVVMLLPLILIGWVEQAAAHPVQQKLSLPLQNPETYQTVKEVSKHAESMNTESDPTVRLTPRIKTDQDHMTICCLHANILEFYLNEVLPKHKNDHHNRMHTLRTDLSRVSEDLKSYGCNVTRHHHLAVEFRGKLQTMGDNGITKAMGEIDIMFTFLQGYCVANSTAAPAAAAAQ